MNELFKNRNKKIKLNNIFRERNEKTSFKNVVLASVGKMGIRLKNDVFSKINVKDTHLVKIANRNDLVIGMGSKQIDSHINLHEERIGVSVAYKVFEIINNVYDPKYLDIFLNQLNKYFSSIYMIIGARQGKTVNIDEWFDSWILAHDEKDSKIISDFITKIDFLLKQIKNKIDLLNKSKLFYINSLFV